MNNVERTRIAKALLTAADVLEAGGQPVPAAKKMSRKQQDKMIEKAYRKVGHGVQINIMDIGKVFDEGYKALDADPSGKTLEKALADFLKKIRQN